MFTLTIFTINRTSRATQVRFKRASRAIEHVKVAVYSKLIWSRIEVELQMTCMEISSWQQLMNSYQEVQLTFLKMERRGRWYVR